MTDVLTAIPQDTDDRAVAAATLKARARNLAGLIAAEAPQGEQNRRVTQPVIDAMQEAGLFRLSQPRRLGGHELSLRDTVEITSIIGRADGSAAWVATLLNGCGWLASLFSDQAQREVWENDPDAHVCGVLTPSSTATRAEGGYRITGSWGFASGSLHSQWAVLGFPILNDEGALVDQGLALIPLTDLTLEDTWKVAGMRATGSNTLHAVDVFVPDHRVLSVFQATEGGYATEHKDEELYRNAFVPTLCMIMGGPLTGLAAGALDLVLASLAKHRGISYSFYERSIDAGSTQISIAQATEIVDTAFLHLYRATDMIDEKGAAGEYPTMSERARTRMDIGYITTRTREALDLLMTVGGAGSFAEANPLQRMWRDANVASRHAVISPNIATEAYGRVILGINEPVTPLL